MRIAAHSSPVTYAGQKSAKTPYFVEKNALRRWVRGSGDAEPCQEADFPSGECRNTDFLAVSIAPGRSDHPVAGASLTAQPISGRSVSVSWS